MIMELKLKTILMQGNLVKIGNLVLDETGLIHLDLQCDSNNEVTLTSNLSFVNDVISQWDNFVFIVGDKAFFNNDKIIKLYNIIKNDVLEITSMEHLDDISCNLVKAFDNHVDQNS
jgi:hypothetical protein